MKTYEIKTTEGTFTIIGANLDTAMVESGLRSQLAQKSTARITGVKESKPIRRAGIEAFLQSINPFVA